MKDRDHRTQHHLQAVAITLWGVTIGLMASAWILTLAFQPASFRIPGLLALTGCALAPAAGVAHLRIYHIRMQRLVRMTAGLVWYDDHRPKPEGKHEAKTGPGRSLRSVR